MALQNRLEQLHLPALIGDQALANTRPVCSHWESEKHQSLPPQLVCVFFPYHPSLQRLDCRQVAASILLFPVQR